MLVVPPGVGYVPHGNAPPDPYEAASLHERARGDHQRTLDVLLKRFQTMGGSGLYNNHVDLFARLGERRFLIEAKSLPRPSVALDRMRYGVGQLMDYRVRYEAELMGQSRFSPSERAWSASNRSFRRSSIRMESRSSR